MRIFQHIRVFLQTQYLYPHSGHKVCVDENLCITISVHYENAAKANRRGLVLASNVGIALATNVGSAANRRGHWKANADGHRADVGADRRRAYRRRAYRRRADVASGVRDYEKRQL